MRTIEGFAGALLARYSATVDVFTANTIGDDYAAGEYEVAAISIIEVAPVTAARSMNLNNSQAVSTP